MHSAILSGLLCMALPAFFGMTGVWMALPLADMLTALAGIVYVKKSKKSLTLTSRHMLSLEAEREPCAGKIPASL